MKYLALLLHIHQETASAFIKVTHFLTGNAVTERVRSFSIFNFISGKEAEDRMHFKIDLNSQQIYYCQSQVNKMVYFQTISTGKQVKWHKKFH